MKKLLMLVVITVLSTALFANSKTNIVKTENEVYFLKTVKVGVSNTISGTKFNGEKVKFTKEEVTSYTKNGVQYDKVSIVKNNCCTEKTAFMKVIAYKNGFKVYKYEFHKTGGTMSSEYLVFKDSDFVVTIDQKNKANLCAFFEIK